MKADITDFIQEISTLRDAYMQDDNKGGARVAQQVLTLSEIYSKYDFTPDEFYGHLHKTMAEFSRNYEVYETEEAEANPVVLAVIMQYKLNS